MNKRVVIGNGLLISLILLSGCAVNKAIENIGSRDSLMVLKWLTDDPHYKVRSDVMDKDTIKETNEFLGNIDWEEDALADRSTPQYQIGNYQTWMTDQAYVFMR